MWLNNHVWVVWIGILIAVAIIVAASAVLIHTIWRKLEARQPPTAPPSR